MLTLVSGNLFDASVDALVNPVNTAGVMGKGLALQFKRAFPANFAAYRQACRRGEVVVGKMFVFDASADQRPRYIVNFPTKQHFSAQSKFEYIDRGLEDLVKVIARHQLCSLAVPPLGAGLGGLDWPSVRDLVLRRLGDLPDVDVLLFEPWTPR